MIIDHDEYEKELDDQVTYTLNNRLGNTIEENNSYNQNEVYATKCGCNVNIQINWL